MATDIQKIKRKLAKPATKFVAGGFCPTNADEESWLGRVFLFRPEESIPKTPDGKDLLPFAQFFLPSLPYSSPLLKDVRVLTLFVAYPFPEQFEEMGGSWVIREYLHEEDLIRKDLRVEGSYLKPFPLKAELVPDDYPLWDGGGIPPELEKEIIELESSGVIGSYYDVVSHAYEHKIGGYPSFCQLGVDPGNDFEFVFQISSDSKIHLNVVDNGSLMFWKNKTTGSWVIYYDFY